MEDIVKIQAELTAEKAARLAAETEMKKYADELKKARDEREAETKKTRIDAFKQFCEDQVKAGKMLPAARNILADALDKHIYTDASGLAISADVLKAFFEQQGKVLPLGEKAEDGKVKEDKTFDTPSMELYTKAIKLSADQKITYTEAAKRVLTEDAELAERYRKEPQIDREG